MNLIKLSFFCAVISTGIPVRGEGQIDVPADAEKTRYVVQDGTVAIHLVQPTLKSLGLAIFFNGELVDGDPSKTVLSIVPSSTFLVEKKRDFRAQFPGGVLRTRGAMVIDNANLGRAEVLGNLSIEAESLDSLVVKNNLDALDGGTIVFRLSSLQADLSANERSLKLTADLSMSATWAESLGSLDGSQRVIGSITLEAQLVPAEVSSDRPAMCNAQPTSVYAFPADELYPDVIVASLYSIVHFGDKIDGISSFAVGTNSCNIGTDRVLWKRETNEHPVIAQSAFRLRNDRFEQIGMSWIKHGFYAISGNLCGPCNDPTDGTELGVGCSDPYSAHLNGMQSNLSPKSMVNANTGYFPDNNGPGFGGWPICEVSSGIDCRLQIRDQDLNPELNMGARYFVQGHYMTAGDCRARTHNNNASYREVELTQFATGEGTLEINESWQTQRGQPALRAWKDIDAEVTETDIQIDDEGLFIVSSKVIDLGTGYWRYEYAVQNLNSDRSARFLRVPLFPGTLATNIGFHDIDYHSGELYDPTDWVGVATTDAVTWSAQAFDPPEEANALRWDAIYNFFFDSNVPGTPGTIALGLFKPVGTQDEISGESVVPASTLIDCNNNRRADACDISCSAPNCNPPCAISGDCDVNGVPDECQEDCNENGEPDACEILTGASVDCDDNNIPDDCEPDCNLNRVNDWCDINIDRSSEDCNGNTFPDECEIDENSIAGGGPFFCIQNCDPDCDNNGIPDACETHLDPDNDQIYGCDDFCPNRNPGVECVCGELVDCCFPQYGYCYSDYNLEPIPVDECESLNGVVQCEPSPLCRHGCLYGDVDNNGLINMRDVGGFLSCFGVDATDNGFAECVRIYDYDEEGHVALPDYEVLFGLLLHGTP